MINQWFTNEYTSTIQKVINEVVNDPKTFRGSKYLPSVTLPVNRVYTEVIEATGGMTNEHLPGTNPKYIQSFGTRVQEYKPPFYKEAIHYDEQKLLFLREIGNNNTNVRGVQQRIDMDLDRLNRRIETRIEFSRWQTIFNGGFSYMGSTISFGIPSANRAVPVGAKWSLDGTNPNNSADPIKDLRFWLTGAYAPYRKYKVTGILMNPNTARWILENTNTKAYLTSYGANPAITGYDVNTVLNFLIPGIPMIDVYDGWYQTESVDNATGRLSVSDGQFFIPDGYIYFETSLPGNDKIGEFVQTVNLANGSISNPGAGKFVVVDDNTGSGTKGGPANPYVDLIGGVYGGVKLDRAFDTLTAYVL